MLTITSGVTRKSSTAGLLRAWACWHGIFFPKICGENFWFLGIHGSIAVQARQTLEETSWLLRFADDFDFIRGSWVGRPLPARSSPRLLSACRSLKN